MSHICPSWQCQCPPPPLRAPPRPSRPSAPTDGRDGDAARPDAQLLVEQVVRLDHGGKVQQRLAHAHEHCGVGGETRRGQVGRCVWRDKGPHCTTAHGPFSSASLAWQTRERRQYCHLTQAFHTAPRPTGNLAPCLWRRPGCVPELLASGPERLTAIRPKQVPPALTDIADAVAELLLHSQHLVNNLVWRQAAGKAALACGAERAPHRAPHLPAQHRQQQARQYDNGEQCHGLVRAFTRESAVDTESNL